MTEGNDVRSTGCALSPLVAVSRRMGPGKRHGSKYTLADGMAGLGNGPQVRDASHGPSLWSGDLVDFLGTLPMVRFRMPVKEIFGLLSINRCVAMLNCHNHSRILHAIYSNRSLRWDACD